MPEIKQNFIRGKMNKDLDERLIQKGEYREAQNVHIVESTDSDTGAIENTRGNVKMNGVILPVLTVEPSPDYDSLLNDSGNTVIGYCKDIKNKRIIYFVTDIVSNVFADNIRANTYYDPNSSDSDEANDYRCGIVLYDVEKKTTSTLVSGSWLNFSKNHLITSAQIIDDLLFWTDNYNQPRKINIKTALDNYFLENNQYYNHEEQISVAKYAPYKPIMLHEDDGDSGLSLDSNIDSDYMKERFVRFSYRYKYDDGEYSLFAPFTQIVFEPLNAGVITNSANDNETNSTSGELQVLTGKKELYKSTTVPIMQNRLNKIVLRIPVPNQNEFQDNSFIGTGVYTEEYSNPFNIKEIDVVLKESDGLSFKLVKTIQIDEIGSDDIDVYTIQPKATGSTVYYRQAIKYTYRSDEPFKVLPEREVTRVSDQVPLKAKALEIIGNRVVYGNFVENYPFPVDSSGKRGMNYTVGVVDVKSDIDQDGTLSGSAPYLIGIKQWMHNVYKYHTLKQRRTYQVGIVFSDIFGRQSPVILSSSNSINADTTTTSPVTADYSGNSNGSWSSSRNTYGQSLKIIFEPGGLSNDPKFKAILDKDSSDYNPHGWYSYRIVVKQIEQDYYNIYAPHSFDGWDNIEDQKDVSLTGGRSWLSLSGDNINKVPRALNDTEINRDGVAGSNARLYPKIVFTGTGESALNDTYHELTEVISLGTALEQNLYLSGDDNTSGTSGFSVYNFVYGKDKNPMVAELPNMKKYHSSGDGNSITEVLFCKADTVSPPSTALTISEDQAGSSITGDSDDQYNDYSINSTSITLTGDNKEVTIIDYTASTDTATLSSKQDFTQGDRLLLSRYYEGLSVFETEPFKSKIDIYYETSTAGLVSDLIDEIDVNPIGFPSDLLLKQDTLTSSPFTGSGGDQPPIGSSDPDYGQKVVIYEDFNNGDIFGILSATQNAAGTLSFDLESVVNVGTGVQRNEIFEVFDDSGTYKIRTTGDYYLFQNNNEDKYKVRISATDSASGTTYHDFDVQILNSKPNIFPLTQQTATVARKSFPGTIVIEDYSIDNGSNVVSGSPNNQLGLTLTFSFPDSTFDLFFQAEIANGKYTFTTTSAWTDVTGGIFFQASESDRTVTFTATDASNTTATTSFIINQKPDSVLGNMYSVNTSNNDEVCNLPVLTTYYAIQGTNPSVAPSESNGYLSLAGNHVVYTNPQLANFAPAGSYIVPIPNLDDSYARYTINSSGVVTDVIFFKHYC